MNNPLDLWRGGLSTNPFREMTRLQRNIEKMFDGWQTSETALGKEFKNFNPSCEVTEDKDNYRFKFDLPGMPKDQIRIELDNNVLTVSGERKEEAKRDDKEKKIYFSEMYYGSFSRSFTIPTKVDSEKVGASYDQGILTVSVAKLEPSKIKQIAVK